MYDHNSRPTEEFDFADADEAAELLAELDAWRVADSVKANPDAPQLPVRRRARITSRSPALTPA